MICKHHSNCKYYDIKCNDKVYCGLKEAFMTKRQALKYRLIHCGITGENFNRYFRHYEVDVKLEEEREDIC